MPAKCVIFTAVKKFDGNEMRLITPGEYIQMSGRAGRRGIDPKGVVIVMLADEITPYEASELFSGQPDELNSAFKLGYNMILNLTRVEGLDPLYLLSRSFFHFQKGNERKEVFDFITKLYTKIPKRPIEGESMFKLYLQRSELKKERQVELKEKFIEKISKGSVIDLFYTVDNIPYFIDNAIVNYFTGEKIEVSYYSDGGIIRKSFSLNNIDKVYKPKVKVEIRNFLRNYECFNIKSKLDDKIKEVEEEIYSYRTSISFDRCLLCMNYSKSCVKSCKFIDAFQKYVNSEEENKFFSEFFSPHKQKLVEHFRIEKIESIYLNNHREYQKLVEIHHLEECQKMLNALKRLNYCDDKTILPKGKIACEISSGHELVLTEMIFNGEFSKMELEDVVSLLSCFVFEEWQNEEVDLSDQSMSCYKILQKTAKKVISVLNECDLCVEEDTYLRQFSYEIMDVVRLWVCCHTFGEICLKTSIFEGSIIRCFRRLEELLRQMCSAARVIGNVELENLFAIGITKIKRDIVFAGSLYL